MRDSLSRAFHPPTFSVKVAGSSPLTVGFVTVIHSASLPSSVNFVCFSRFVRFNVQQAILVDILTVVLGLLGTAAGYVTPEGEQFMTNFAFYCLVGAVAYAVAETARGRMANQVLCRAVLCWEMGSLPACCVCLWWGWWWWW